MGDSPETVKEHLSLSHNVGRLEGRLDGLEGRFNHFEDRIETRLTSIEAAITKFSELYLQGRGVKLFLLGLGSLIVIIPNLISLYKLIVTVVP